MPRPMATPRGERARCGFCLQSYRLEHEVRCAFCDRPVCPLCVERTAARVELTCPECDAEERRAESAPEAYG